MELHLSVLQHVGMGRKLEVKNVMMAQMTELDVVPDARDGQQVIHVRVEIQQAQIHV